MQDERRVLQQGPQHHGLSQEVGVQETGVDERRAARQLPPPSDPPHTLDGPHDCTALSLALQPELYARNVCQNCAPGLSFSTVPQHCFPALLPSTVPQHYTLGLHR